MNFTTSIKKMKATVLLTAGLTMMAGPAHAAVDLMAVEGVWTSAAGQQVRMWGFAADAGSCPAGPVAWQAGPEITEADLVGGDLTINLRNCLAEAVSIVIPGQREQNFAPQRVGGRIRAFTHEAAAGGGTATYIWQGVGSNLGTYLYMSGSHPAKQVQMGLYGPLKLGQYPDTSGDVTLLYSEIDPVLHDPPAAATPLNYKPRYYLVNGVEEVSLNAGDTSLPTVLSFLNAGLDFHVPALNGGYMSLQTEDGNPYPYERVQYSVNLPAGKTVEAFWQPTETGEYQIFDRRGNGMLARLTVGAGAGVPQANDDLLYEVDEDNNLLIATAQGVLVNDVPNTGIEAELVIAPAAGTLSCPAPGDTTLALCLDGSFQYEPTANFNGEDSFTYRTKAIPHSNIATVTITVNAVNDPPEAVADTYEAVSGVALTVAAPGVLGNDQDIDGDNLSVNTSTLAGVSADGSFSIASPVDGVFTYEVCDDGTPQLCHTADITITTGNDLPVAVDDATTVKRNSSPGTTDNGDPANSDRNIFSVIANDTDANGINPASVVVSDTSQGGTVVSNGDGTVSYTPPRGWRGTDTFTYTVEDTLGAPSNEATVRVNVVRRRNLPPL